MFPTFRASLSIRSKTTSGLRTPTQREGKAPWCVRDFLSAAERGCCFECNHQVRPSVPWLAAISRLLLGASDSDRGRMRTAPCHQALEPARPQIGNAGVNVEDQDTHGIRFWLIVGVTFWPHINTLRANFSKSGIPPADFSSHIITCLK
jgi:hypothetical protein